LRLAVADFQLHETKHRLHEDSAVLEYCQKIDSYFRPGICHLRRWICALLQGTKLAELPVEAAGQI
jgi:hypothetical protein